MNRATNILNTAINIIFIGYPIRTALGVVLGVALSIVIKIFSPLLSWLSSVLDLSRIAMWEYLILGVVILHVKTIYFHLFKKGSLLGENEEKALEIIRLAKKQGVSERRIQQMYMELCEKILEKANLKQTTKQDIERYLQR